MDKVYERTTSGRTSEGIEGTTAIVSQKDGMDEINSCMIGDRRKTVLRMSSISRTDYHIVYRNGEVVVLKLVNAPQPPKVEQAAPVERTAVIYRRQDGDVTGRVVTVKGKDYVLAKLVPADRPVHAGAPKGWKPTAYVTYWSVRNGERFGATRTAGPDSKPGTVGHALFHNAMDHVNSTGKYAPVNGVDEV